MLYSDWVALAGFAALFGLMALRLPIGFAMGLVGVGGFAAMSNWNWTGALNLLQHSPIRTATDYTFTLIPMFLLMGAFASASGMSRELFHAANAFLGHRRGGLGMATIGACAGFAAICGSSVATAATFSAIAYPEMRRFGYPDAFATGVIAAGGTLGIMIPPSVILAIYGILTDQDIGKLFIAGVVPGLLATGLYMLTIRVIAWRAPALLPAGPRVAWGRRFAALKGLWAVVLLFLFVIGGIYGGMFTATEAAAMGASGTFLIAVVRGRLSRADALRCLVDSLRTTASIFTILIGALIFGYFLAVTQTPQKVTAFLSELGWNRYAILLLVMALYLVLGCILDAIAMILLTIPIVFPLIVALEFDPIWFGVIIVMTVELALITPPVGMNVYVIKGVLRTVSLGTIFRGVAPFVVTDVLRLLILILFPILVLWLPQSMR